MIDEHVREICRAAISTIVEKESDILKIENCIYEYDNSSEQKYKYNIYQIICEISKKKLKGKKLTSALDKLRLNWDLDIFTELHMKIAEQDDFILNPFEVEEGVLKCNCGSERVFSYSKQVRSADEGQTTFAQCMQCKAKWTCRG
jgi:DNA-directed RNA polymerase subunit M/transcription elongation factor TFIIS